MEAMLIKFTEHMVVDLMVAQAEAAALMLTKKNTEREVTLHLQFLYKDIMAELQMDLLVAEAEDLVTKEVTDTKLVTMLTVKAELVEQELFLQ